MNITLPFFGRKQASDWSTGFTNAMSLVKQSSDNSRDIVSAIESNENAKPEPKPKPDNSKNSDNNNPSKNSKKPKKKSGDNNTESNKSEKNSEPEQSTKQPEISNENTAAEETNATKISPSEKPLNKSASLIGQFFQRGVVVAKNKTAKIKPLINGATKEFNSDRSKYLLAGLITLAPVLSLVAIYNNPLLGTYVNAVTLAILTFVAIKYENLRKLSISIAILPIIHLFNLSVPQQDLFLRTVIFYSLLLLLSLTYRYLFTIDAPKKRITLGSIIAFQSLLIIMIVIGQWQYEALQTYFSFDIDSNSLTLFMFILFAVIEEAYFRGLVQANAIMEVGRKSSIAIASLLFGFSFMGPDMPLSLILGVIFGVLLSILYAVRRNLILNIFANMLGKLLLIGLISVYR